MATTAEEVKQTLSFKILKLLEKREPLEKDSNLKSFSDSELIREKKDFRELNVESRSKSKSENCLANAENNLKALKISQEYISSNASTRINMCENTTSHDQVPLDNHKDDIVKTATDNNGVTEDENELLMNSFLMSDLNTLAEFEIDDPPYQDQNKVKETSSVSEKREALSPYRVLEDAVDNKAPNENFLCEPRCVTIKKCNGEINPFLTSDSLIFEPDFEADVNISGENINNARKKQNSKVDDIFLDEDDTKSKKRSSADREEGELTPEARAQSADKDKTELPKVKPPSDIEFFSKINECLRDLDKRCKDIYSSSADSKRSVKYLQSTLKNVDSIKRKLTYLTSTKNSESDKKKDLKKVSERHSKSGRSSRTSTYYSHSKTESGHGSRFRREDESSRYSKGAEDDKARNENTGSYHVNRELDSYAKRVLRHSQMSGRGKASQADLYNRKRLNILGKLGTKEEIQRIQSLFKRQMNMITQHVIQKTETNKSSKKEVERKRRRYSSERQDPDKQLEKIDINNLNTLDDMEAFLDILKNKSHDKVFCEQYLEDEKRRKTLKFTSKKKTNLKTNSPNAGLSTETTIKDPKKVDNNLKEDVFKKPVNKEECNTVSLNKSNNESVCASKVKQSELQEPVKEKIIPSKDEIIPKHSSPKEKLIPETTMSSKVNDKKQEHVTPKVKHSKSTVGNSKSDHKENISSENNNAVSSLETRISNSDEKAEYLKSRRSSDHNIPENKRRIDKRKVRKCEEYLNNKSNQFNYEKEEGVELKRRKISEPINISDKRERKEIVLDKSQSKEFDDERKTMSIDPKSVMEGLLSKKVVILNEELLGMNGKFCIKVIGNEVYLRKVSDKRKHHRISKSHQTKSRKRHFESHSKFEENTRYNEINTENVNTTLEKMEDFLQDLRSKRKVTDNEEQNPITPNPQEREVKFLARIQAKRKAKLMACVSGDTNSTEKEAKFLKALEKKQTREPSDSSDLDALESRKLQLMEKIRAETDAIVLSEKPNTNSKTTPANAAEEDPLQDVKAFLNMIKEAEAMNDENLKQDYVSFSLKRSDVKKLENLTSGHPSSITEESQKLLNNLRAKMRAKKMPVSNISSRMLKPEM